MYVNNITNPYLEITRIDGGVANTDILSVEDNFIHYAIPFAYYSAKGTMKVRLRSNEGDGQYINFQISDNFTSTNNLIVKIENDSYIVKAITYTSDTDLPIATTNSLGGIIVGDNLTIDSNGRLSSTGEGLAATVTVGTTTTGAAGTNANVTNSGTSNAAILNFVIPRGNDGEDGADGSDGADGADGREIELRKTSTYIQWRYVGDTTWSNLIAISDLKGGKGDTGDAGSDGITPNISIGETTTLAPGSNATVTQGGTTENPIFSFGIPQGKTGADGKKGDPFTYADFTEEQLEELKSNLTAFYKEAKSTYTSTTDDVSEIPITIEGYRNGVDLLSVYINGYQMIEGTDYTKNDTSIILTKPIHANNSVHFVALRATAATAADYELLKGDTGAPGKDGEGFIELISEDQSNPICLFDLDEGIYKIYGYIKYYPTYEGTAIIQSPSLISVAKSSTTTYVQILEAAGNSVTGFEITETDYEEVSITGGGSADYDSLPVGAIVDFEGDEIPVGYEEVEDIDGTSTDTYSTEEQVVGTWVDGKPLYRKVFNNITVAKNSNSTTSHGISNLGVIARYTAHSLYNGVYRSVPYSNASQFVLCEVDSSNVHIYNTTANPYAITVIIEYTKTTD